jgi:hypothetical protein
MEDLPGKNQITVRSGQISSDGQVTLTMPEPNQDYQGMTRWLLKKGGGLDLVFHALVLTQIPATVRPLKTVLL